LLRINPASELLEISIRLSISQRFLTPTLPSKTQSFSFIAEPNRFPRAIDNPLYQTGYFDGSFFLERDGESQGRWIATDFAKDGETEGEVNSIDLLDGKLLFIWTSPGKYTLEVRLQQQPAKFNASKSQLQAS